MRKIKTKDILIISCLLIACVFFMGNYHLNKEKEKQTTDASNSYKTYETIEPYYGIQNNIQNEEDNNYNEYDKNKIIGNINFTSLNEVSSIPTIPTVKKNIDTNDIVFVGNSLVEGLRINSNDDNVFLCKIGINLNGLKSNIYKNLYNYSCNTVVIGMGTNELGSYSEEGFKNSYMELVNHIYSINENSIIICLSIPPVSEKKSNNDKLFNNNNVELYNEYIKELCNENNLIYIDNSKFFGNVLSPSLTGDGIHLKGSTYKDWYNYIIEEISRL